MLKRLFCTTFFCLALSCQAEKMIIPPFSNYVVDTADIIDSQTEIELNKYLKAVQDQSNVQIAILTVPSTGEYSIEEYATSVFDLWQPGQKKLDNGVLMVVAVNDRTVRIETGYGLEEVLTDTKCGLIIRNIIIPDFKEGNYSLGIKRGTVTIDKLVAGDVKTADSLKKMEEAESESSPFAIIPVLLWIIFVVIIVINNRRGGGPRGGFGGPPFFGGGFGGSSGGNFGGGSFGGGGGGRSGGGGASGRW